MFSKISKNTLILSRSLCSRAPIRNIGDGPNDDKITVKGWVKNIRKMKEFLFLDINDGSSATNLQVVIPRDDGTPPMSFGSALEATGLLAPNQKGQIELRADTFKVIGQCPANADFPFAARQNYPPEAIRQHISMRSRVGYFNSILRVRHYAAQEFIDYLTSKGFIQIHTPILTTNDCEGAGEAFRVRPDNDSLLKDMAKKNVPLDEAYFDQKVFLSVSGQLHLEAMCHGLGDVFCFGPTFRAENSRSSLHLSEFYMLEAEKAFVQDSNEVSDMIEECVKTVTRNLLNYQAEDIENVRYNKFQKNGSRRSLTQDFLWLDNDFFKITYKDAVDIIFNNQHKLKHAKIDAGGLSKEQELFIVDYLGSPGFVVDWPGDMKPFYMKEKKDHAGVVEAIDFLAPMVGELVGGSVREDDYKKLKEKIPDNLEWYLDLRKYGGITTGGFGLGFDRYLQMLLHINSIKDVVPFPRWAHNCSL